MVNSDDIEKASIEGNGFERNNFGGKDFKNELSADFTLKGYSSIESMNEFIEGNYRITDGEVSENFDDNSCLINSELATLNELKVGDTIKAIDSTDTSKTYELVISGIYEEKTDSNNGMNMFADSVNTIITNSNFVNNMGLANSDLEILRTPTFILTSKEVIDDFSNELTEKGLNENLIVQSNLDKVDNATNTISNVKTFATTFLIITLIIGAIVLIVINMINVRERKYEIGVLRTIGMKRGKVCLQFVTELFIVSFCALILGALIGAIISVPVSNDLLKNEIKTSQNESSNIRENFGKRNNNMEHEPNNFGNNGFKGVASVQAFDNINANVNLKVLAKLLTIGLLLTLISSISAITSIQKFSPLTILKERS